MTLRIGTAEAGSTFHLQGEALAEALAGLDTDREVLVTPTASIGNAERLSRGEIDVGFMAANWVPKALAAEPPFAERIDLRLVAPMNVGPMFFVSRADSKVDGIMGLRGRRLAIGAENSGMHQHTKVILGALGLGVDEVVPIFLDVRKGAEALLSGEVDVQFQPPIPNPIMTDLAARGEIRAVEPTADEIDRVTAAAPHYRRTTLPAGAFRGHRTDMPQLGVVNVLVAHASAPRQRIAALVDELVSQADWLSGREPLFATLPALIDEIRAEGAASLGHGGVEVHPGALDGYRRLGFAT